MKPLSKKVFITTIIALVTISPLSVYAKENFERIDRAGTYFYPFYYTTEDGITSITEQKATIIFPYSHLNKDIQEGIDATDIHTKRLDLYNLSDQELIALANAHAWSMETGLSIPIHEVFIHENDLKPGSEHKVVFSTNKNTQVSIDVYFSEHDVIPTKNKYINLKSYRVFEPRNLFWLLLLILLLPLIICTISFAFVNRKYKETIDLLLNKEEL